MRFANFISWNKRYVLVENMEIGGLFSIVKDGDKWHLVEPATQLGVFTFGSHSEAMEWIRMWHKGIINILPSKKKNDEDRESNSNNTQI